MAFKYFKKDKKYVSQTYGRFDACIKKGKNATAWDIDGKKYIDFTSGIGVNSLGYANKDWAKAVSKQAKKVQHTSNLYYTKPYIKLAEKLCTYTGYNKVFFANSGAEANEGAIKAARKYSFDKYGKSRTTILTLKNSFHGRTITTLSATGQDVFHDYFFPFTDGFCYAPANDFNAFLTSCTKDVCAVMLEFIQGEGGVLPLDEEYIDKIHTYCQENDILFIADEVQTGVGRTGTFLASEQYGIIPDITTLAKGLGNGLPIGAVLFNDKTCDVLQKSQHGTTFGANPVACAGANVVVDEVCDAFFLDDVIEKGEYIRNRLSSLPQIDGIDGCGLMLGIRLNTKSSAAELAAKCVENGLLILTAKEKLRLLPPLTITYEELERGIDILIKVLKGE